MIIAGRGGTSPNGETKPRIAKPDAMIMILSEKNICDGPIINSDIPIRNKPNIHYECRFTDFGTRDTTSELIT